MRADYKILLTLTLTFFCVLQSRAQFIGYSFSYGLPYTLDQSKIDGSQMRGYEKGPGFSIGLGIVHSEELKKVLFVRLSQHSSRLYWFWDNRFPNANREMNANLTLMELEGYFLSKANANGFGVSLGARVGRVLRSEVEEKQANTEVSQQISNPLFGGLVRTRLEFLARIDGPHITISKEHTLVPSYLFGLSFSKEFNTNFPNSRALNHRFELTLFKRMGEREG